VLQLLNPGQGSLLIACTQFDKYDPEIIRSHPGVRLDLFHRPLERTLITDFFGGVAHAQVMTTDLMEGYDRVASSPLNSPFVEIDLMDGGPKDGHELIEVLPAPADGTGDSLTRLLRAWGSVGILGLLVTWATLKTKL
jgi:GPI-anchor transamidase subunit K